MAQRKVIDARGSFCPGPLMELVAGMKLAAVGDELEVISTDKDSAADIPHWINKVGHEFIESREENGAWYIAVKKIK